MPDPAITAHALTKTYPGPRRQPPITAIDDLDLEVPRGAVLGLLGHNGAGKTTTVRVLATLVRPDSGTATVAGFDLATQPHRVRGRIALIGQYAAVDEILTGRDNLVLFSRLNGLNASHAKRSADELLDQFGLTDAATRPVVKYSGGMRRRLDLAAGLITTPEILFVDEPTTGLDPAARRDVWRSIADLAAAGTTIVLTTQYLEEADELADSITIMRDGSICAQGTPTELKASLGGDRVEISCAEAADRDAAVAALGPDAIIAGELIVVPVSDHARGMMRICERLSQAGLEPSSIALRRPTLDDVFLNLTERTPDKSGQTIGASA